MQKLVMGAGILGCIYYKWGYLTPLVLQLFMTPSQLIESELFSIYVRGKDVARPFPVVSPFGLPSMPEAPAAEAATPVIEEISTDNPADETKKAK